MQQTRRLFMAASAIAPIGCGIPISREHGIPVAAPMPMPLVRLPQIEQEWRYLERDFFSQTRGVVVEKISSIGKTILQSLARMSMVRHYPAKFKGRMAW